MTPHTAVALTGFIALELLRTRLVLLKQIG